MSEAARTIRRDRRAWARPHSSHDKIVSVLRTALPMGIGVLAAFLVMAPLSMGSDASFVLDKNKVDLSPERLRLERASYRGEDDRGRPFQVSAGSAVQKSSAQPIVQLNDLSAQIYLTDGPAKLAARRGHYDMSDQKVAIDGPIQFRAADGYSLDTQDVTVNLRNRTLTSRGAASGDIPLGSFSGDRLSADLDSRNVKLQGNVRLRITPKAPNRR